MSVDYMKVAVYQLEATSICNLSCSFCPKESRWADRQDGLMDLSLIDKVDWSNTRYTELQMTGESTLHPQLAEIVKRIKSKGVLVGLSSNGTRKFDFSIFDSVTTTQDSEREFKIEGENVDYQTLGESHPYEDYTHKTPLKIAPSSICMTPYNYVSIQWDGDVVPCCKSHGKQHVFGNLHDQSFEDIIKSHKRMAFLDNMMEQGKKANYICRYCTDPNPHKIHEKLVSKINARSAK